MLKPLYFLHGDEIIQLQQELKKLQRHALDSNIEYQVVDIAQADFCWQQFALSLQQDNLFSQQKMVELRIHQGVLDNSKRLSRSKKIFKNLIMAVPETCILVVVANKLAAATLATAWCSALLKQAVVFHAKQLTKNNFRLWITKSFNLAGYTITTEIADIISRCYMNNHTAVQMCLDKIATNISPPATLDLAAIRPFLTRDPTFSIFQLIDYSLAGNTKAIGKIFYYLKQQDGDIWGALWSIAREIRTLIDISHDLASTKLSFNALLQQKYPQIWQSRYPLLQQALARVPAATLNTLLANLSTADRMSKGDDLDLAWQQLLTVCLTLAGYKTIAIQETGNDI